jgi:hypothetical protein
MVWFFRWWKEEDLQAWSRERMEAMDALPQVVRMAIKEAVDLSSDMYQIALWVERYGAEEAAKMVRRHRDRHGKQGHGVRRKPAPKRSKY